MGRSYGFERNRKGLVVHLDVDERRLIASIAQQVIDLVAPPAAPADQDPLIAMVGIDVDAQRSDDPAVARLFPDAYRDDDDAAGEFRRFTERDLRAGKVQNAQAVIDTIGALTSMSVLVPEVAAMSWLGFLNDARLTIGTRLGITDDSRDEFDQMDESDPRFGMAQIYDWLTYLQDSLLASLSTE